MSDVVLIVDLLLASVSKRPKWILLFLYLPKVFYARLELYDTLFRALTQFINNFEPRANFQITLTAPI